LDGKGIVYGPAHPDQWLAGDPEKTGISKRFDRPEELQF